MSIQTIGAEQATRRLEFPTGFAWGAATAAYQIEGAIHADGRLPSIWDVFCQTPGRVAGGDTGEIACDHYHRLDSDLDLMAELGLQSYRFSVSWPRVIPSGSGPVNQAGLDFYQRLVDGLLARGIAPQLTLYHWDLPQSLQNEGGWTSRETVDHFVDFAVAVATALGDRVPGITTFNEPFCSAFDGYAVGQHAPGERDRHAALTAAHHLNLAHGRAIGALRSITKAQLSITLNLAQLYPASDSEADRAAAEHVDRIANRIFLDPIFTGGYPAELLAETSHLTDWAFIADGDLAEINRPIDALGVNFYSPASIAAPTDDLRAQATASLLDDGSGPAEWPGTDLAFTVPLPPPHTGMGWPIRPQSFTDLLLRVHRDLPGTPIYITENGAAFDDEVTADGAIHDVDRIAYVRDHLAAIHTAIAAGADIRGYYLWSFMDNFEWAWGYSKRFGMVHIDYQSLQRTPKDSAHWYADVIGNNAIELPLQ
ncbi:MAG: GH1 family beta-glucosidase [Actinomycetota bacterium]|nr:GH1 family beta-glucosidase [Actinomycetota bacterium]MDQ2957176.1 GH1 family beta-glucosidase [Actinomycetota bacterium]